ncbi:cation transporter [Neisseria animalis]|uniref:Cation diffusion facilitator family transporter n=1 Tax=Neisseria animalis TaxID=492 RepID=A0A5P3MPA4_NEIAN|nr:cation transporter [Neisseria animalis]QEY23362.1 cation diffusion facilitator family transporter [Neisseria animalis]ROW33208.1 cation diffusion facilitator family transporter [Neisseria animalis]VEE08763.1 putative heavy metal transport protein [Neisseria animalis]
MRKTRFKIAKMDCPSEERLIRMRLEGVEGIRYLSFDIAAREMTAYHENQSAVLLAALDTLDFGSSIAADEAADSLPPEAAGRDEENLQERGLLYRVLAVNFVFFLLECGVGLLAGSMGLLADSLDMLADSFVYLLALLAVGAGALAKKRVALAAGVFQFGLAFVGLSETLYRFFGWEMLPDFRLMIAVSLLALCANAWCLHILNRSRSRESHIRASMIFTSNDIIINLGVVAAGILTWMSASRYPDLVVGAAVFVLVCAGAWRIVRLAKG